MKICNNTSFESPVLCGANITPNSQVHTSAMAVTNNHKKLKV